MSRRLASISLLCAWLCASGAMLDVAQTVAWGRMFAGYVRSESLVSAAKDTFDPAKPCNLCLAVKAARQASCPSSPAAPSAESAKIILACVDTGLFVGRAMSQNWPAVTSEASPGLAGDVPLPPPRQVS